MLISESYRALNRQLHESTDAYGTSGSRWVDLVRTLSERVNASSILDYGCGKGRLRESLGEIVHEYDPAIPGKSDPPELADVVVCTDVLEHVEPECIEAVIDDLGRLTRRVALLTVNTAPANKILSDGRNAHLIVQPSRWWLPRIMERFELAQFDLLEVEFSVLVKPRQPAA